MKVLMIGAGRDVRGGVSTVVNGYYEEGLDDLCELTYLPTMKDGSKLKKLMVAGVARLKFEGLIKSCDILHVHMSADASFHRKAIFIKRAYELGKKIIIHMHGSTFDSFYKERLDDAGRSKVREIFAMADMVIALSEYWHDFMADNFCDANKIKILYNGIPIPSYCKADYSDENILFLGIIGKRKGAYDLINAMADVIKDHPQARLYMGGDGEVSEASELAAALGLADNFRFLGWVRGDDKEDAFKQCSIYCLPSYNEGMPMSVLEAMGRGLCTISTNIGGIPHIIEDDKNGVLILPGDVKNLARQLDKVLTDKDYKKRLGEAGRRTIEIKFNLKNNVKELVDIYREICQ